MPPRDETNRIRLRLPRAGFTLDVDLTLPARGTTALYGASGSGKTSILRCVAGLEQAGDAFVRIAGKVLQDDAAGICVPPWRRDVGYVFQEASLFEHLDVAGNLHYGLRRGPDPAGATALDAAVELLGIGGLRRRRVHDLSGGERQRVAIARALAARPRLLLLDEPLAALDQARRSEIMPWLEALRDESGLPILYVTHSPDEVARLADTLVLLEQGRAVSVGTVSEVFGELDRPALAGEDRGALVQGFIAEIDARWHLARVEFNGGSLWIRNDGYATGAGVRMRVLARDVSLTLARADATTIQNHVCGVVEAVEPGEHPADALVRIRCGEAALLARVTQRSIAALALRAGTPVWAQVKTVALVR